MNKMQTGGIQVVSKNYGNLELEKEKYSGQILMK